MWTDKPFYGFLMLGPAFWAFLFFITPLTQDLSWPARELNTFLLLVLVYPVVEEIIFRGLIQDFLNKRLAGKKFGPLSYANLVTSGIFTALHFFYHAWLWSALVFLPSLVFGYARERYNRLKAPIVLHISYNLGYYWLYY